MEVTVLFTTFTGLLYNNDVGAYNILLFSLKVKIFIVIYCVIRRDRRRIKQKIAEKRREKIAKANGACDTNRCNGTAIEDRSPVNGTVKPDITITVDNNDTNDTKKSPNGILQNGKTEVSPEGVHPTGAINSVADIGVEIKSNGNGPLNNVNHVVTIEQPFISDIIKNDSDEAGVEDSQKELLESSKTATDQFTDPIEQGVSKEKVPKISENTSNFIDDQKDDKEADDAVKTEVENVGKSNSNMEKNDN